MIHHRFSSHFSLCVDRYGSPYEVHATFPGSRGYRGGQICNTAKQNRKLFKLIFDAMMNVWFKSEAGKMKNIHIAVLALLVSVGFSHGASADVKESWKLCKTELKNLYGDDAKLRLWNINDRKNVARVQVIVIPKNEARMSVNCRVDSGTVASIVDGRSAELLAVTESKK